MTPSEQFTQSLGQTVTLSTELLANLNRLKADLDEIIKVLGYPKTVDDDLHKLNDALTTTSDLLSIVSIIPEVGEAAAGLKDAVIALQKEIQPAIKAADAIEAKVKPLREALQKLEPVLDDAIKAVTEIQTDAQAFLKEFTEVSECVNSLPDGTYKTQAQNYLNEFAAAAEPYVQDLNTALSAANTAIEAFYNALKELENALAPLEDIINGIESVLNVLDPVISLLNQLADDLKNIKITIPFLPYPIEVSLYDVFKDFSQFIDLALKPIQDLVNEVLNALHITLPDIPGLSDLLKLVDIVIPDIPDISALLDEINKYFQELEKLIDAFNLQCPPDDPNAGVPGGGKFSP